MKLLDKEDVITCIKKHKGDVILEVNGEVFININPALLKKYDFCEEDIISLESVIKENYPYLYEKGMNLSFNYLSYRPRTSYEMKKYLTGRFIEEDVTADIILRLEELNYVNDREYIKNYIHNKVLNSQIGISKIKHYLKDKGITLDEETIAFIRGEYPTVKEEEKAYILGEKTLEKLKDYFYKEKVNKIISKGVSRGFNPSLMSNVAFRLLEEYDEEENVDYDKIKEKIRKKILKEKKKIEDEKKLKYKVKSYFYAKGASSDLIEEVFCEFFK